MGTQENIPEHPAERWARERGAYLEVGNANAITVDRTELANLIDTCAVMRGDLSRRLSAEDQSQSAIPSAVLQMLQSERGERVIRKFGEMFQSGLCGLDCYNRAALRVLLEQSFLNPHSVREVLERESVIN